MHESTNYLCISVHFIYIVIAFYVKDTVFHRKSKGNINPKMSSSEHRTVVNIFMFAVNVNPIRSWL